MAETRGRREKEKAIALKNKKKNRKTGKRRCRKQSSGKEHALLGTTGNATAAGGEKGEKTLNKEETKKNKQRRICAWK